MTRTGNLHLKTRPDGYGYIYGVWQDGEHSIRVDIMPPRALWDGDMMLPDRPPHETDWVVYADGEEIARVQAENVMGLEDALRALPAPFAAKSKPDAKESNDKPLTFLRALRCLEYGLLVAGAVCAMLGVSAWVVVPLLMAALSASALQKYIELWPAAQRVGAERAWWRTVALSMLSTFAAACGTYLIGIATRWLWGITPWQ